jgi:hypothetical protein
MNRKINGIMTLGRCALRGSRYLVHTFQCKGNADRKGGTYTKMESNGWNFHVGRQMNEEREVKYFQQKTHQKMSPLSQHKNEKKCQQ